MAHHFLTGEAALWVQRSGPNTIPVYLGCHALGDVDQPEGDLELIYCPDESGPNRFKVVASVQGAAGAITSSITTDVTDEIDELERAKCPFTLFVHMSKNGRKDLFTNFDRSFVLTNTRITSRGLASLVARTPDDNSRAEQSFDISAETLLRLKEPEISRQTISEVNGINDITFCNAEQCRTDEEVAMDSCQVGFAVTDPTASGTANVLYTSNGGTWAATATDPFAADEVAIGVECFDFGRDTTRVIVARGTTDVAAPAEIAYSDDNGTTWTAVEVGAVDGAFAPAAGSLFALDRNNIWLGTDDGFIYYSDDGGLTWTAQESGTITTTEWNSIHFVDANVGWAAGENNEIARTIDGGTTWSAITGPAGQTTDDINVVFALDRNHAWIGFNDGTLWYTRDAGANWSQRSFSGSGVGEVRDIKFLNDSVGYMLTNNATPVGRAHWTIDGGYTWQVLDANTNAGYNSLFVCDEWSFFIAGEAQGSLGYIAKGSV